MKAILKHLEPPTKKQIITVRILRFLGKVALMPGGRLTREILRSQPEPPVGQSKGGANEMYVHVLKAAPLDYWTLTTALSASGCTDLESTKQYR
jgi:hypothetical protein